MCFSLRQASRVLIAKAALLCLLLTIAVTVTPVTVAPQRYNGTGK